MKVLVRVMPLFLVSASELIKMTNFYRKGRSFRTCNNYLECKGTWQAIPRFLLRQYIIFQWLFQTNTNDILAFVSSGKML